MPARRAWPALPLVLWTMWTRGRGFNGGLGTPGIELPGTLALVIMRRHPFPEPEPLLSQGDDDPTAGRTGGESQATE